MSRPPRLGDRLPAALSCVLALLLVVTACSNDDAPATAPEPKATLPSAAPVAPDRAAKVASPDGRFQVSVPTDTVAGEGQLIVRSATAPDGRTGYDVDLSGTTLTGTATLRFAMPERAAGEPLPLIRSAAKPGGRYTTARQVRADGDEVVVRTRHFSFWTIQPWSVLLGQAKKSLADKLDRAASAASNGKQPRCTGEKDVRAAGYKITSDSGRRVYWCLGLEGGRPVLRVVNARGYGAGLEYTPGLRVTATDRKDFLNTVADLVRPPPLKRGNKVALLPPGNGVDFTVEGTSTMGVLISPDAGAYLITALAYAVETARMVFAKVGVAASKAETALEGALDAATCLKSFSEMATNDLKNAGDAAAFFQQALSTSFDCVSEVVDDIDVGPINEFIVQPLLWLFSGLKTVYDGTVALADMAFDLDGYQIVVTPPADAVTEKVTIDPFTATGLRTGWRLDRSYASTEPLDCSYDTGSPHAVGPATHDCGSVADAANACWAGQFSTAELWCLNSTDVNDRTLTVRAATAVDDDTPAPADPAPLFLELGDGSQFWYRVGGAWGGRADGLVPGYGCMNKVGVCASRPAGSDGNVILADPEATGSDPSIDTSGATWRVKVGLIGDPGTDYPEPQVLPVARAWFIAGHRWQGD